MYVVVRSYSGQGASELFDLLAQREEDVKALISGGAEQTRIAEHAFGARAHPRRHRREFRKARKPRLRLTIASIRTPRPAARAEITTLFFRRASARTASHTSGIRLA